MIHDRDLRGKEAVYAENDVRPYWVADPHARTMKYGSFARLFIRVGWCRANIAKSLRRLSRKDSQKSQNVISCMGCLRRPTKHLREIDRSYMNNPG